MRNLKKFLALVLSVMMVLSLVVTASATSISGGDEQKFNDNSAIEPKFVEAVEVLNGMDVLKGDADTSGNTTGNFRPADTITRAEVAAMVFRLATGLTGSTDANHFAQYGNFSDVRDDAWYAGYVGYCANAKYIKGYAGEYGPFGPVDNVTGYQALAMILRAVGYGVNGEFDGASWQVEVAAIAQQTGILKNINSTAFGGATLQQAARRDVVAEIFFQAAQLPRVVYTPAFGYQTTNVAAGGGNKTSLGYANFGLVGEKRIVVGNQATGESSTVLGQLNADKWSVTADGNTTNYQITRYDYPGKVIGNKTVEGLNIDLKSGLDLFGHEIKVWYNDNSGAVKQTYAYTDEVVLSKMVYSTTGEINDLADDPADDARKGLGTLANGAGFSVNATDDVFVSDRYGRIITSLNDDGVVLPLNANEIHDASPFSTPKAANATNPANPFNGDEVGTTNKGGTLGNKGEGGNFYLLISNNSGKKVDVVVSLAAELAVINKHDTTSSTKTLQLGWLDGGVDRLDNSSDADSQFGVDDNGIIRMNSLTSTSEKALGSLVAAWEIVGTAYGTNRGDQDTVSLNSNQYFYQLNKIEQTKTGVVSTYEPSTGKVTLTTGEVLNFTLLPVIDDAVPVPGEELYFYNGVEYTFYLDEMGRYVKAERDNGYQFLYSTFGDYEVGGLGTGTINYAVTGVNWDGEKQINLPMSTIDNDSINGLNYEPLAMVKKNLGTSNNAAIGNELQPGKYTAYAYNAGTKDLGTDGASTGRNNPGYYYAGRVSDMMSDSDVWSIGKSDVTNGWYDARLTGDAVGSLLLTPNTRFILVEGTGSATLNVDIRDGISALLGTADNVTIDTRTNIDLDRDGIAEDTHYNMYYRLIDETYNNVDTKPFESGNNENQMVRTIILPKDAVTWSNTNTLYFTTSTGPTGTYLADTDKDSTIRQYVYYQNGVRGTYFVDESVSDNPAADNDKVGEFFNLTEIRKINGTPIYKAERITAPQKDDYVANNNNQRTVCNVDYVYEYYAVNNTSTARINGSVYNVSNAQVVNLSAGTITNVRELNNAVSIGWNVKVAIVNSGLNVSLIYITEAVAP